MVCYKKENLIISFQFKTFILFHYLFISLGRSIVWILVSSSLLAIALLMCLARALAWDKVGDIPIAVIMTVTGKISFEFLNFFFFNIFVFLSFRIRLFYFCLCHLANVTFHYQERYVRNWFWYDDIDSKFISRHCSSCRISNSIHSKINRY